jgi:hypothetical protein
LRNPSPVHYKQAERSIRLAIEAVARFRRSAIRTALIVFGFLYYKPVLFRIGHRLSPVAFHNERRLPEREIGVKDYF